MLAKNNIQDKHKIDAIIKDYRRQWDNIEEDIKTV